LRTPLLLLCYPWSFPPCPRAPRILRSFPTRRSSDLHREREHRFDGLLNRPGLQRRLHVHVHQPPHEPEAGVVDMAGEDRPRGGRDRKSTRLNSSHVSISYAVFCLKKKKTYHSRPLNQ